MSKIASAGLMLTLLLPAAATADSGAAVGADSGAEIRALRQEISAIRVAYEARLQALEQRLQAAETASAASAVPAPTAAPATAAVNAPAAGANAFNPSVSLILSGLYAHARLDPTSYAISGFQLPAGTAGGAGMRGFSLSESELGLAASIDPWLRGAANFSLHPDNTVSVEEAFVQTTSLGDGLSLKAGRFFSGLGYLNAQHSHTWDFVDNPLAYQVYLGTQYSDDGVQMTWLAPIDQYLELGVELGRGRSFPGNPAEGGGNGAGMTALTSHTGGDIGNSQSWRAGLSMLKAKASGLAVGSLGAAGDPVGSAFSGSTRVWVLDGIWKWAPNGNATRTSFKLQGEYLRSAGQGSLVTARGNVDRSGAYRATQSGWYLQGVYQFMPGWRVGLRTEQLDPGTPEYGDNAGLYAAGGYRPRKDSLMFDFSASEFSRVRLQFAQDRSRPGPADPQVTLQYQMSLGAHGAHSY